jgi:transcriptional regulator with XRE-family HTH domain
MMVGNPDGSAERGTVAQAPRDLVPHRSVRHFFGAELRRLRTNRGLSQDRLGSLVLQSGDTIGKVEKAERWPTHDLAARCDRLLDTGGDLARLWPLVEQQRLREDADVREGRATGAGVPVPHVDPQWWLSAVWHGRPVHEALHKHDTAELFGFLEAHGWSQAAIATATGLSANRVRAIRHRGRRITAYQELERLALGLDIDRGLLGLAFTVPGVAVAAEPRMWTPRDLADTVDDVRRRSALSLPALAAAAAATGVVEPWNRLAYALTYPDRLDEQTVEHLQWRTREFFDREEYTPSRWLASDLRAHIERMTKLAADGPVRFHGALMTSVGEALALAAWLAWDSGMSGTAERTYEKAAEVAKDVEDGPLLACTLGYRSYLAEADGDLPAARELLVGGQAHTHGRHSAGTRSWLAAREAEVAAALSAAAVAQRALDRALTAYDYAHPRDERSWTAFFTPSRLGGMAVTAYARTNHPGLERTTETVLASLPDNQVKAKAIILADVATAIIQLGDYERGAAIGHRALDHPRPGGPLRQGSPADPARGHWPAAARGGACRAG